MTLVQIVRRVAQTWVLFVIVGSLQPSRPGPVHAFHREIHFAAFGGGVILLLLLAGNRRQEIGIAVSGCLVGLCLEYLQHLLYHNVMEWWDVRDDTLAVLGAFLLYQVCRMSLVAWKARTA